MVEKELNKELNIGRHMLYTEWYSRDIGGLFMKINKHVYAAQSAYQRIDIFDSPFYGRVFSLDGITMTTERDEFMYHEMLVHVPMFMHPNPRKVLVIGGGDGGSIREILKHPSVEKAVLCEIDEMVVKVAMEHLPYTGSRLNDPKVELLYEDGAKFVRQFKEEFDVIIIDSTDPTAGEGGQLFTVDFYKACSEALKKDGILSAQTEGIMYDYEWGTTAYKRIKEAFPLVRLYLGFMPTYPGGMWSYTYASKSGLDPIGSFDVDRVRNFKEPLRYYNEEIHKAAFALPNFVKKLIEE